MDQDFSFHLQYKFPLFVLAILSVKLHLFVICFSWIFFSLINRFGTDYVTLISKLPRSILQYQLMIHVLDVDHLLFLLSRKILFELKNIQPFDLDTNLMGAGPVIDQMWKFDSYYTIHYLVAYHNFHPVHCFQIYRIYPSRNHLIDHLQLYLDWLFYYPE